jgi:signal transduction histidine kinase
LKRRTGITPAVLGGLIAVASVGAFLAARAATDDPDRGALRAVAASAVATVSAHLEADARLLEVAAEAIGGDSAKPDAELTAALNRVAPSGHFLGVVRTTSTASAVIALGVTPQGVQSAVGLDLAKQMDLGLILDSARDDGRPAVSASAGADGRIVVVQVRPLYGGVDVPVDVTTRRNRLNGYLVLVAAETARLGLAEPPSGSHVVVRVAQRDAVITSVGATAVGTPPADAVTLPVNAKGVSWTVAVWSDADASSLPWILLAVGVWLACAVVVIALRREQLVQRSVASAEARAKEVALVARTGPLLQQSLTLSDLLPAFVVEVSDEFELVGAAISLLSDSGRLVRVFSNGTEAPPFVEDLAQLESPPATVAPGEVVNIPLLRAGRVVGVLRARATAGLSAPQTDTLFAVCNVLAAALGNARLFQQEQEMVVRLRDVDRMKTTFVSSVSHELRTSVTAIEGFASLLEGDPSTLDDARRADYVERIRRNARSLVVLVEDLLDFARFERAGSEISLRPIDLSELVPQVVEQMSSLLGGRRVSMDIAPGVVAMGDLSAVERILVNLLSNASKYTPEDDAVDIVLERDGASAVLTVADHGPGIPEAERERIFELFYRINDGAGRATRGIGIGLALARQLVHQLDGTITAEETPGGGATFRVTIPLASQAVPALQPPLTH